jgi:hypothetical protein
MRGHLPCSTRRAADQGSPDVSSALWGISPFAKSGMAGDSHLRVGARARPKNPRFWGPPPLGSRPGERG